MNFHCKYSQIGDRKLQSSCYGFWKNFSAMTLQDAGIVAVLNKTFLVSCSINSTEENTAPFCSVKTLKRMSHLLVLESFIQIFYLPENGESLRSHVTSLIYFTDHVKKSVQLLRTYYIILSQVDHKNNLYYELKVYNIYKSIQAYLI